MSTRTLHRSAVSLVLLALVAGVESNRRVAAAGSVGPRALQIGKDQVSELPRGKEADGIIGDFVLRNSKIEALVSGNLPSRKANMGTNWDSPTPGCLYDLSVRSSGNDQLTCWAPGNLHGMISSVIIVSDGTNGVAHVRAERTAAIGNGLHERHDYKLDEGAPFLRVHSTWTNAGKEKVKVRTSPAVKGLRDVKSVRGISFGDAQNPNDRQGYAWTVLAGEAGEKEVPPGESIEIEYAIAPGRSPADAFARLAPMRGATGTLRGLIVEEGGAPISTATAEIDFEVEIEVENKETKKKEKKRVTRSLHAYTREDGGFEVALPPGEYPLTVRDLGRPDIETTVTVGEGEVAEITVELEPASRVHFVVTEGSESGRTIPCKVQFLGVGSTSDPRFGVPIQARGCDHQYHSEIGDFTMRVPAGKYRVVITRGMEYSHHEDIVDLRQGATAEVRAVLDRVVDTTGWISTDYHNHSTPSGDNYCGTDDRVINLAAEHIEFAPTTEHNRLYDWAPHIKRLGLEADIATVVGIELTGPNAHFNSFPLKMTPYRQDNGAPTWVHDPRINAIVLREFGDSGPDRWVHINHPQVGKFFRDRDADGVADGGYPGLEDLVDAAEVWSTEILNLAPTYEYVNSNGEKSVRENRTFAWLQLLNQGRRMWCIAVSDAHSVFGNGVGAWRTYVPSSTDEPGKVDYREIIRHSKAGRMVVTNGPFLEVTLDDGTMPGGLARASGEVRVKVRVQTTTWIDIDRVQVLVNGRAPAKLNFTRAANADLFKRGVVSFEKTITVPLSEDAHLIVAAVGENHDLETGYGRSWQSAMHPVAFTNPIYVDIDGNGFRPNGDTLGFALPLGK